MYVCVSQKEHFTVSIQSKVSQSFWKILSPFQNIFTNTDILKWMALGEWKKAHTNVFPSLLWSASVLVSLTPVFPPSHPTHRCWQSSFSKTQIEHIILEHHPLLTTVYKTKFKFLYVGVHGYYNPLPVCFCNLVPHLVFPHQSLCVWQSFHALGLHTLVLFPLPQIQYLLFIQQVINMILQWS